MEDAIEVEKKCVYEDVDGGVTSMEVGSNLSGELATEPAEKMFDTHLFVFHPKFKEGFSFGV